MTVKKGHVIVTVAVVAVAALVGGVYPALRAGRRTAERSAREFAAEAESQVDAGGAQQRLGSDESGAGGDMLAQAGQTPEATVWAYYYYKDRGLVSKMRPLVAQDSAEMVSGPDGGAMSARAQELRGIVVDHVDAAETEATVYFRSWFSLGTKAQGGRPYVFRLLKEDGAWKVSVPTSMQLTLGLPKGRNDFGFYDGTKEWWK